LEKSLRLPVMPARLKNDRLPMEPNISKNTNKS
jgi:hypothetical protein